MEHYERHCPPAPRRFNCLIPLPVGYQVPIRWPRSRDEVRKANIPHPHLVAEKSDQRWMVVNGDKINFPGGGTHFHTDADKYIVHLVQMLNFPNGKLNNGGNIRNVLDVGCGVASFGAYLLSHDILTIVIQYWKHMKSEIRKDSFRNVMDMSANLGGFAASMKKKDV
ncbi:probable methyltransferase PMT9 [Miscanthus floridulus]|uniref:probable methyltransferase PMT9 n=1 Tax=Miscanthus floridulus TaxID=154761 RepID=UPI00345A1D80